MFSLVRNCKPFPKAIVTFLHAHWQCIVPGVVSLFYFINSGGYVVVSYCNFNLQPDPLRIEIK